MSMNLQQPPSKIRATRRLVKAPLPLRSELPRAPVAAEPPERTTCASLLSLPALPLHQRFDEVLSVAAFRSKVKPANMKRSQ
jgi:hypothetical protein